MNRFYYFLLVLLLFASPIFAAEFWNKTQVRNAIYSFTMTKEGELNANASEIIFIKKRGAEGETWDTLYKQSAGKVYFEQTILNPRGEIFAATGGGILQSSDDGKGWQNSGLQPINISAITVDKDGFLYAGGGTGRVYRSRDNGKSWWSVLRPKGDITALAVSPQGDLYAGAELEGIVYRSSDKGQTFQQALSVPEQPAMAIIDICINSQGRVFVGERNGFWLSDVDGNNFVQDSTFTQASLINIDSSQNIYAFGDTSFSGGRLYRSDGGKIWQKWQDSTMGLLHKIITTPDGYMYAGTSGQTQVGLYRSVERSIDHPVVWGTTQSCDEASFVVMDDSLASVDFVQASSSNVSVTVTGSFPSPKVKVTVKLIDSGKEGTYTLHAKNIQGKDLVYTAHLNTFTEKPTIERSQDTLWASGGYIFQWYKEGVKLDNEEREFYVPKTEGKYSVTSIHVNGCMTESVPYNFTLSGVEQPQTEAGIILDQNSPNPFSEYTSILYTLAKPGYIRLVVTDALGRTIAVLADGMQEAGEHRAELNAQALSTGVYYYRLETAGQTIGRQMLLVK